jgi:hypothetical protein
MPRRILILFAHPSAESSRVGRRLLDAAAELRGVTIADLYERYPRFDIDVRREQAQLLDAHDVIVWQHPFYWYAAPAHPQGVGQDLVLAARLGLRRPAAWHLRGKLALNVRVTTGGSGQRLLGPRATTALRCATLLAPYEDQTAAAVRHALPRRRSWCTPAAGCMPPRTWPATVPTDQRTAGGATRRRARHGRGVRAQLINTDLARAAAAGTRDRAGLTEASMLMQAVDLPVRAVGDRCPLAKRLGLGSVLGYLLAGVVIGPFVLGLVGERGRSTSCTSPSSAW